MGLLFDFSSKSSLSVAAGWLICPHASWIKASIQLMACLGNSLSNSGVIPAERAAARESRNPGNKTPLDARFRGYDGGEAADFF